MYSRTWLLALFIPEVILAYAFEELIATRISKAKFNAAQAEINPKQKIPGLQKEPVDQDLLDSDSKWTLNQTFCVNAGGLVLQTPDDWIYTVSSDDEMVLLIQEGLVSPLDLRQQDIEARAKQDWLGKLFTLLQVTWFFCNVIARWAYQLPVSPFELTTFAYCILAMFTYAFWWYKPKDIGDPIAVPLPYNHDDMPTNLRDAMNSDRWMYRRMRIKEEHVLSVAWDAVRTPFLSDNDVEFESVRERIFEPSAWLHVYILLGGFVGIAYSGIHLAAWDFTFPTQAEWVAWITFSFMALGAVSVFNTVNSTFNFGHHLRLIKKVPSSMRFLYEDSNWNRVYKAHIVVKQVMMSIYIIARLGIMALVFSSLLSLPKDSYTAIEWVTSIPHF